VRRSSNPLCTYQVDDCKKKAQPKNPYREPEDFSNLAENERGRAGEERQRLDRKKEMAKAKRGSEGRKSKGKVSTLFFPRRLSIKKAKRESGESKRRRTKTAETEAERGAFIP